ncbi:MAG: LytTR family DNA-binding domain-containing protein [Lachnospiraceae bacterium]|nr:LytTR family DNA-binding domain-containing protein [Lachnospiraceae bacterium]
MKKNVLILEDNEYARSRLLQILEKIDSELEVFCIDNVSDAYQLAVQYTIDVFLLDIVLDNFTVGDASGIIFAQKIRALDKYSFSPIIFTTTLEDPKLYAFTDIHSFAYLEKPYEEEEATRILEKALDYTTARMEDKSLFFRKEGLLFSIKSSEIVYIENYCHALRIQTVDELLEMPYRSCKKLIEELDSNNFLQCSRATIVNKNYVLAVDCTNHYLILKRNLGQLIVGRTFLKSVKDAMDFKEEM